METSRQLTLAPGRFGLSRNDEPPDWVQHLFLPQYVGVIMITCYIEYTLDPHRIDAFERYATAWPKIIARCGGRLVGYFLPKEGATNVALALIDFESLADYERYRARLAADPDATANLADASESRCILVERRSFLRRT